MSFEIDIQYGVGCTDTPAEHQLKLWAETALSSIRPTAQLTIRIVDEMESQRLNKRWRNVSGPTNVLSFAHVDNLGIAMDFLGDIVICGAVVRREALDQNKDVNAHWAHMVVHGILHLNGFDHEYAGEAKRMEDLEIEILKQLNYNNPYVD